MSGASQAAEKLDLAGFCNKGTTSVGPQMPDNKGWALAPAGCFSGILPKFRPFSAACLAPEGRFQAIRCKYGAIGK
jgi:hypothetical protein